MEPGGTSYDVFQGFPKPVYGKTGTAQFAATGYDQSWYVAYVPDAVKPIVVAATIESGGFGAESAAPAVRLILSQWFGVEKRVVQGMLEDAIERDADPAQRRPGHDPFAGRGCCSTRGCCSRPSG